MNQPVPLSTRDREQIEELHQEALERVENGENPNDIALLTWQDAVVFAFMLAFQARGIHRPRPEEQAFAGAFLTTESEKAYERTCL